MIEGPFKSTLPQLLGALNILSMHIRALGYLKL